MTACCCPRNADNEFIVLPTCPVHGQSSKSSNPPTYVPARDSKGRMNWRAEMLREKLWDYSLKYVPVPAVREMVEEIEALRAQVDKSSGETSDAVVDALARARLGPVATVPVFSETQVREFCGYLTAALPELHEIHPERVWRAWEGYLRKSAEVTTAVQPLQATCDCYVAITDDDRPHMMLCGHHFIHWSRDNPQPSPITPAPDGLDRGCFVIMELMQAYERRVRSACTTPEELAAQPWRCAEFIKGESYLKAAAKADAALTEFLAYLRTPTTGGE